MVQSFRGDAEPLQPVLVPGSGVQLVLKCAVSCVVKVVVTPLRCMWLQVTRMTGLSWRVCVCFGVLRGCGKVSLLREDVQLLCMLVARCVCVFT